jgi:glycosyltransferase involved in cell wall biosynthesis
LLRYFYRWGIKKDFKKFLKHRPTQSEYFSDDRCKQTLDPIKDTSEFDIINLHWVAHFLDYVNFFSRIPARKKIVWTLHDMNPFTGGCHYSHDCEKFTQQCGACPQLSSSLFNDFSHQIWRRKKQAFSNIPTGQLHIVTPSHWLADEVKRSSLLNEYPISVVPYGTDIETFIPRNKSMARQVLGIESDARVILFLANKVNIKRKGFQFLRPVLNELNYIERLTLITVGGGIVQAPPQINHIHLGKIESDRLLCLIYNAASLFITTSIQDNLPNTIMESLACGSPVIAFKVGGIPEMVCDNVTGSIVPLGDTEQLSRKIKTALLNEANLSNMSDNCRHIAVQEYDWMLQADRYIDLYKGLFEAI